MGRIKIILLVFIVAFIAIQFIPSVRNQSGQVGKNDISRNYKIPENVHAILVRSCYDCHSNNTTYPWYSRIQPFRYLMDRHVTDGKKDLNFNEFGSYSQRRQMNKLRSMGNSITDGTMPLASYIMIHRNSKINEIEKQLILKWVEQTRESISVLP